MDSRCVTCGALAASLTVFAACGASPTMPSAVVSPETTAAAPLITPRYVPPPGPSIAVVRVSEFRVVRSAPSKNSNSFHYIPLVRLAEDGGVSAAWITGAVFTLLDIGSAGRVPDPSVDGYLPAGGTLDFLKLVGTVYGDPDVEISSSINATRVRVTITFADNQGRAGSVTAAADVDP